MRAMTWLVGVLVIVLALSDRCRGSASGTAVWLGIAVLWFLLGAGLGTYTLARLAAGKYGVRLNAASHQRPREVPAPKVEHGG